jgi:hypothetical protein
MLSMARFTRNYRESLKSYIQFLKDFGVLIIEKDSVEYEIVEKYYRDSIPVADVLQAPVDVLEAIASDFHALTYNSIPEDPYEQLYYAIRSVLNKSMANDRRFLDLCSLLENDLLVHVMVHSDRNLHSGTGVVYTRSPLTGAHSLAGEYISQSLDGRSSVITSKVISIDELYRKNMMLEEQLTKVCHLIEDSNRDMQAIEFAVEDRRLFLIKAWSGTRSPEAALKIASELARTIRISPEEALFRVRPFQIDSLTSQSTPTLCLQADIHERVSLLGKGRPSSSGIATGIICFSCCDRLPPCEKYILVCDHTAILNDDLLDHASGFICSFSAMSCPLTRKARLQNKPHIVDVCSCDINIPGKSITTPGGITLRECDTISMNAFTGEIFVGERCPSLNKSKLYEDIALEDFMLLAQGRAGTEIYLYSNGINLCGSSVSGAYIDSFSIVQDHFGLGHHEVEDYLRHLAWLADYTNNLPRKRIFRLFGTSEYELNLLLTLTRKQFLNNTFPADDVEYIIETVIKKQLIVLMEAAKDSIRGPVAQSIVVGPVSNPNHLKHILDILSSLLDEIKDHKDYVLFHIGVLIDSPFGCFNIAKLLDVFVSASIGDSFETCDVIFKFDPLVDLLMGSRLFSPRGVSNLHRAKTIYSMQAFDDWGIGVFLEHCIVQIRSFARKSDKIASIGVLASCLHDHEVLVKFCNQVRVDWIACGATATSSALLSSAQAHVASPCFEEIEVISET